MGALFVLVRIRLNEVLRRPATAFWFFVLPLVFVSLVAVVFQNGHPFERRHVAVVGDPAALSPLEIHEKTGAIVLEPSISEESARAHLRTRSVSAIVIAEPHGTRVVVGTRDAIFGKGLVAELGDARFETIDLPASGYVTYLVPGMLAQAVVIAGLFGMGFAMVRYRETRFLRKLATTPLRRFDFVLSQILARVVLVTLQLALLLLVSRFAFDVPLTPVSFGWVLATGAIGLVTFMGIGFVVSCLVESADVVVDIINAVAVPIGLLSEIFFPSSELPRALAILSSALPSTQMVRIMRAVLLHGDTGSTEVLFGFGILGVWAVLSFGIAIRAFRWR